MKRNILVLIACIMLTSMLVAQTKKTVAVLEFDGGSGQDGITLTDLFAKELANKRVFNVLTRTSVDAIMDEHKFQRAGVTDTESLKAIGALVNADYIIVGKILTLADSELLTVQMVNVVTGQVEAGEYMTFEKIIETVSSIKTLPSIQTMVPEITVVEAVPMATSTTYAIGDRGPGGGLIFYITGSTYYECNQIQGDVDWEVANQMAENYRGGGYDDWYLPSKEELNYVYENLATKGFVESGWFWSSSELTSSSYGAWIQDFGNGTQYASSKPARFNVQVIRAFNY